MILKWPRKSAFAFNAKMGIATLAWFRSMLFAFCGKKHRVNPLSNPLGPCTTHTLSITFSYSSAGKISRNQDLNNRSTLQPFTHSTDNCSITKQQVTEALHLPHNCIKFLNSSISTATAAFSSKPLVSNTLCHLPAALEPEGLKCIPRGMLKSTSMSTWLVT